MCYRITKSVIDIEVVCQATGGALTVAAAQGVFQTQLVQQLRKNVPDINPAMILSLGAADEAVSTLPAHSIVGIHHSYVLALRYTFAVGIPVAGIALISSFFQPWIKYHDPHKNEGSDADKVNNVPAESSEVTQTIVS